jgi:hypothetical protein
MAKIPLPSVSNGVAEMNTDIRVDLGFFEHRKTRKMIARFGLESAWGLLRLWAFCARERPDGSLLGMSDLDIAMEMHVDGKVDPGDLVAYMKSDECRWIDEDHRLHNWKKRNPWAAGAVDRSDKGRFVRLARLNPEAYSRLKQQGVDAISRTDYDALTSCQRPVKPALTPTPAPAPVPEPKSAKPSKPVNPSVHILQEHLKSAFEKKFGVPPVMNYPAIGKQIKILLERDRFTEYALKEMVDWFLESPKSKEHPTPTAALSADTVQRWQIACPEEK